MAKDLMQAILSLNPDNAEHWTSDGLPRLDAVEKAFGSSVNRKAITNAAPDYNRDVARERLAASDPLGDPLGDPLEDNSGAFEELSAGLAAGTDTDLFGNPDSLTPAQALDAEIDEARQLVERFQREQIAAKRNLEKAEQLLSQLIDAKNQAFPPMSAAEAIMRFQDNELAKRAARLGQRAPEPIRRGRQPERAPILFSMKA